MINEIKDIEQKKAIKAWKLKKSKGTLILPTSFGKTRVGTLIYEEAIRTNKDDKWIIGVPLTNLKENEWVSEAIKWGCKDLLPALTIECYQTLYHAPNGLYDGYNLIADEIHLLLTPEYGKLLKNHKWNRILGLSARVDDEKIPFLNEFAPVCYQMSIITALKLKIVSNFVIYNLLLKFTPEEEEQYSNNQRSYDYYESLLGGRTIAFSRAKFLSVNGTPEEKALSMEFFKIVASRKYIIDHSANKITVCNDIINLFSNRHCITFADSIKTAEEIYKLNKEKAVIYHSKLNKKERQESLNLFKADDNEKHILNSVKALNTGLNVEKASLGICISGSSKTLQQIQMLGRIVRLSKDNLAIFVNLCINHSQDVRWVTNRTKEMREQTKWITDINQIVIPDK